MVDKDSPALCTYCGEEKTPWDEDHVPPRILIGFDHASKVPSCRDCHCPTSKDDEYFAFAVTMAKSCDPHPSISEVRQRLLRGLGKAEATRYRDLILRNVDTTDRRGGEPSFGNYLERIKAVTSRIVRGLYYLTNQRIRLPSAYRITVLVGNEYRAYGNLSVRRFQSLFSPLLKAEEHTIGDPGVFVYLHARADPKDPYATVWYLRFYGGYELFACSLPEADPRTPATHFPRIHNMHLLPKLATIFVPSCGELSDWVAMHVGEIARGDGNKDLSPGVTHVLRGRLGEHDEHSK